MDIETLAQGSAPRILVIDDESSALRLLGAMLSHARYDVTTCESPFLGLRQLEGTSYDCVITDAMMPEMSGLDLVRSVRTSPQLAATPILMLTRKRQREDVAAAIAAGVTDYIIKPVDEQLLVDKVELCLLKGNGRKHVFRHQLHDRAAQGSIDLSATIISLSESDIVLGAPYPLLFRPPATFESRIFEEIGIRPPQLKFVSARPLGPELIEPGIAYESTYAFVGVPEEDLRRIRGWLKAREILRRK